MEKGAWAGGGFATDKKYSGKTDSFTCAINLMSYLY